MNAFFHTLTGIGVGCALVPKTADGTPLQKRCAAAAAFSLAVLSHGILDGLKHLYPFRAETDLFLSLVLIGAWLLWAKPPYRWFFALAIFGSLLPDLLDHGPYLLNIALGWHIPTHPFWFPWHQAEGDGCFYDSKDPLYSQTNHFIVLSFDAAAIFFNARNLMKPVTIQFPRKFRWRGWSKLMALALLGVFLQGCQYDPYAGSYTTHKPIVRDIPGEYVLEEQTLTMDGIDFLKGKVCRIRLHRDGTFRAENMPPLGLIQNLDEKGEDSAGEDDGRAKWGFNRLPKLLDHPLDISGTWQAREAGEVDDWDGLKTCWGVDLQTPGDQLAVLGLTGEKPPYGLIFTFSDPDLGMVLVFKKVQS